MSLPSQGELSNVGAVPYLPPPKRRVSPLPMQQGYLFVLTWACKGLQWCNILQAAAFPWERHSHQSINCTRAPGQYSAECFPGPLPYSQAKIKNEWSVRSKLFYVLETLTGLWRALQQQKCHRSESNHLHSAAVRTEKEAGGPRESKLILQFSL